MNTGCFVEARLVTAIFGVTKRRSDCTSKSYDRACALDAQNAAVRISYDFIPGRVHIGYQTTAKFPSASSGPPGGPGG